MKKRVRLNIAILLAICTLMFISVETAFAQKIAGSYTAPDGMQIISYSPSWSDVEKLKNLYNELLLNGHGEEIKLLSRIAIYPEENPDNGDFVGTWHGETDTVNGKVYLKSGCTIELFNGETNTTIESFALSLAHEYGHHFTYYYYLKNENKLWEDWRSSKFAEARGLKDHPLISDQSAQHMWLVQEIAAEDYVQLFGSPNVKQSNYYNDIAENLEKNAYVLDYYFDESSYYKTYNVQPQENFILPLAGNNKDIYDYWVEASNVVNTNNVPKLKFPLEFVDLKISEVNQTKGLKPLQYIFTWSYDNTSSKYEYTLVKFEIEQDSVVNVFPVKTTRAKEKQRAVYGSAANSKWYYWQPVPEGIGYFVVYAKASDNRISSSKLLAVDFSNIYHPDTILIGDDDMLKGNLIVPRVKIDGEQMEFSVQPIVKNGRTLVPMRAIFNKLGATVNWEEATQTVTAHTYYADVTLQIGSTTAQVNGKTVTLDVAPQIVDGSTLVPLRFISESLGATVRWNPNLMIANIENNKKVQ